MHITAQISRMEVGNKGENKWNCQPKRLTKTGEMNFSKQACKPPTNVEMGKMQHVRCPFHLKKFVRINKWIRTNKQIVWVLGSGMEWTFCECQCHFRPKGARHRLLQPFNPFLHPFTAKANQSEQNTRNKKGASDGSTARAKAACALSSWKVTFVLMSLFNTAE